MIKCIKKLTILSFVLFAIVIGTFNVTSSEAKVKKIKIDIPKIEKKVITIYVDKSCYLKIANNNKVVKWSIKTKKIAKINKYGKLKGVKRGTTKIYATVGKKKYKFTVKVLGKNPPTLDLNLDDNDGVEDVAETSIPVVTQTPVIVVPVTVDSTIITPAPTPTTAPTDDNDDYEEPDYTPTPIPTATPYLNHTYIKLNVLEDLIYNGNLEKNEWFFTFHTNIKLINAEDYRVKWTIKYDMTEPKFEQLRFKNAKGRGDYDYLSIYKQWNSYDNSTWIDLKGRAMGEYIVTANYEGVDYECKIKVYDSDYEHTQSRIDLFYNSYIEKLNKYNSLPDGSEDKEILKSNYEYYQMVYYDEVGLKKFLDSCYTYYIR